MANASPFEFQSCHQLHYWASKVTAPPEFGLVTQAPRSFFLTFRYRLGIKSKVGARSVDAYHQNRRGEDFYCPNSVRPSTKIHDEGIQKLALDKAIPFSEMHALLLKLLSSV